MSRKPTNNFGRIRLDRTAVPFSPFCQKWKKTSQDTGYSGSTSCVCWMCNLQNFEAQAEQQTTCNTQDVYRTTRTRNMSLVSESHYRSKLHHGESLSAYLSPRLPFAVIYHAGEPTKAYQIAELCVLRPSFYELELNLNLHSISLLQTTPNPPAKSLALFPCQLPLYHVYWLPARTHRYCMHLVGAETKEQPARLDSKTGETSQRSNVVDDTARCQLSCTVSISFQPRSCYRFMDGVDSCTVSMIGRCRWICHLPCCHPLSQYLSSLL